MKSLRVLLLLAVCCASMQARSSAASALAVTRATLPNGLRVVVVRDPFAPVVTAVLNYRVGSNEEAYPGEAHALEHMMFRGTPDVSQAQLFEIAQLMGGDYDADTESEITQFFFEVPAQYLSVAIRLEADRARHLTLAQSGWLAERPAIEQEVTQDDSVPIQKLFERTILPSIFKGTPYARDTLGTLDSFNHKISARVLRGFYDTWYHPNNAVYVIVGDVDGPATIRTVEKYFGSLPAAKLPTRPSVVLRPLPAAMYRVTSDQPYSLVAFSFRLPGWNDKDYAAAQILEAVLNDERGGLYGLVASGKSLYSGFQDIESHADATASAVFSAVPVTTSVQSAATDLRTVLDGYRRTGLPADLVEVAKQRAIADSEFDGNSIEGLAFEWSDAVALRNQRSPDELLRAMERVTVADVNRVFREYVNPQKAIVAYVVPKNAGAVTAAGSGLAQENNTLTPERSQPLPLWAQSAFGRVSVPPETVAPVSMTLSNGMRLVVIPEHVTRTVEVYGGIRSSEHFEAPPDEQGVAAITGDLFQFGTTQYDRVQLRQQLDKIAADVSAGIPFSLQVVSNHFDRGIQLLADEELHPAFPAAAFQIVKSQEIGELTGEMTSPDHLVEVALHKALYPPTDPMQLYATPQTAGSVTLDDVRSYYREVYRPDMTTVVVVGDVTPGHARTIFEKYFGAWTARGPKPNVNAPQVPKNGTGSVVVPDPSRVQSQVELAQVVDLPRSDPDFAPLQVANNVLGGGGFGSVLMDDLRVKHGYVYGVSSDLGWVKKRAVFSVQYACNPDKIVPAEQLALADIRQLENGGISQSRLQRAKAMLMSDAVLGTDSFGGIAGDLLNFSLFGLPLDQGQIDARRELSATSQSVRAAMVKWISPTDFVRVIEGPGPR
jgi:zinc protease